MLGLGEGAAGLALLADLGVVEVLLLAGVAAAVFVGAVLLVAGGAAAGVFAAGAGLAGAL